MEWSPIFLTLKLALITTLLLLLIAIPLSHWLTFTRSRFKPILETLIALPLVLPPTVLGFYFLVAFSPNNGFGEWLNSVFGLRLLFSFQGLVVASIIYSLPFMVQPIQAGFSNLNSRYRESAMVMKKSRIQILLKVLLPNIKPSLLTGIVLSFAHTIGEFGLVLMIGGNIPDKTRVASIAIYDQVESMNYTSANQYAAVLVVLTIAILLPVYIINQKFNKSIKK